MSALHLKTSRADPRSTTPLTALSLPHPNCAWCCLSLSGTLLTEGDCSTTPGRVERARTASRSWSPASTKTRYSLGSVPEVKRLGCRTFPEM